MILDEGHKVKNEDTLVSQGMRRIQRQHVLLLTGTPVQNNLVGGRGRGDKRPVVETRGDEGVGWNSNISLMVP